MVWGNVIESGAVTSYLPAKFQSSPVRLAESGVEKITKAKSVNHSKDKAKNKGVGVRMMLVCERARHSEVDQRKKERNIHCEKNKRPCDNIDH